MRVAFQGSLGYGGLGTVTRELSKHVSKSVEVEVFDVFRSRENGLSISEVNEEKISTSGILAKIPLNLLFQTIGFQGFDLIHTNYAAYGIPVLVSRKLRGPPFIETVHGIPQPEFESGYDKLGYMAEGWALPLTSDAASMVLADSDYIKEQLRKRYSVNSTTLRLGVDTERFSPPTAAESVLARQRLKIPEASRVVLFAGRLHRWKDPLTLVRAADIFLREDKDVLVYLVGKGPMCAQILEECKSLGIQKRVVVDTVSDYYHGLADYYKAADLFVLPTIKEGFGLVVLEAMASGLCVVSSDGGSPPELLGKSGVLFRTEDPYSLASAVENLLSDNELRKRLATAARQRAVELFTWEKCAQAYVKIYNKILQN